MVTGITTGRAKMVAPLAARSRLRLRHGVPVAVLLLAAISFIAFGASTALADAEDAASPQRVVVNLGGVGSADSSSGGTVPFDDLDLVRRRVAPADILAHHTRLPTPAPVQEHHHDDHNQHKRQLLAYITPWNNHGYDLARTLRGTFSLVAPVWYYVRPSPASSSPGGQPYALHGAHDVDRAWVHDVTVGSDSGGTSGTGRPRIVPRFALQEFGREDVIGVIQDAGRAEKLAKMIIDEC
ncbi:hypothetical protein HK405_001107, partial [Cladochytrium tenue]